MYAIFYNDKYIVFESLCDAEAFREKVYNRGIIEDVSELEIEPYHWTMG